MRLTPDLASQIIGRAKTILDREILVADPRGVIVSDGPNIGHISVDAVRAAQEGRTIRGAIEDNLIAWCPFVYEQQTLGSIGIVEREGQVTPEAISLMQGLTEVISNQYFLMEHVQPSEMMRSRFFQQFLNATSGNHDEIFREADILQLNLRSPQAMILVEIEDFEKTVAAVKPDLSHEESDMVIHEAGSKISEVIRQAFRNHPGNIVCYLSKNVFAVSKGIGGESLTIRNTTRFLHEKATYIHEAIKTIMPDQAVTVGVGQYYPELGGLRKSYQEARLSLSVGSKVWGPGAVYHIKQVGMFITLANVAQERKAELAHQILYPLLRDEQLYKTVQTFLQAGLNLTEAAEKLHIHRNTLIYRLDKTKKLIGLDPRVFDDALQIKLGLMFYQET